MGIFNTLNDLSNRVFVPNKTIFRDYDGTKCLLLFGLGRCNTIYDTIRYLIGLKSVIFGFSYNSAKINIDSVHDSDEEKLTLHNVIIFFRLVLIKIKTTTTITFS